MIFRCHIVNGKFYYEISVMSLFIITIYFLMTQVLYSLIGIEKIVCII